MASTFSVTRKHLIFGICLPLALLLGYLLADVQDPVSVLIIIGAIFALSVPLVMKWYHPLLVLTWNMGAMPALPGRPALWAVFAFVGLVVVILNRAVTEDEGRLSPVPSLTLPLLALGAVFMGTAMLTGGISLGILGSGSMGGKNYFYLLAALCGFFVLGSRYIPPERASLYVGLYFLPGICAGLSWVAAWLGSGAEFIFYLFPPESQQQLMTVEGGNLDFGLVRMGGVATAASLVFLWMLARYGIQGVFDLGRPWRGIMFLALIFASTLGGYRSIAIYMILTFAILFFLEKLWRTRVMFILIAGLILAAVFLIGFADRLPFSVQRTLAFLPIKLDADARLSAEVSSNWRLEMWGEVLKSVPQYLFRGKGYNLSSEELYMAAVAIQTGHSVSWEGAMAAGDYHNGPLSLVITFGIYGLLAFMWLLVAGVRYLYRAYRDGPDSLRQINALLLAYFCARIIFFLAVFGAVTLDLPIFTGILGLSIALNVPYESKSSVPEKTAMLEPSAPGIAS